MSETGDSGGEPRSLSGKLFEPSEAEIRAIRKAIFCRNKVRFRAQLPSLDVQATLDQEVHRLRVRKFEALLRPYLRKAYEETPGSPGIAGRLHQRMKAREKALRAMEADLGISLDRRDGKVDMATFILQYSRPTRLPPR